MPRLFKLLACLAVPAAAFLTFLLQPVVGKWLMPRYGGAAGTWLAITVFFQAALLGGYALAFWLQRQPRRRALIVVAGLALAGPLLLRLPPPALAGWPEWLAVFTGLALSLLPAMLLTTSLGLVLQGWLRAREGRVPWHLYGISNLGSLLALGLYPFVIEPTLGLARQGTILHGLLWLLGAVTLGLVWLERSRPEPAATEAAAAEDEIIPPRRIVLWFVTAFLACTLMLGAMRLLSAEIGSNPLAWLVPLGLYLLSFTLTFSGWWDVRCSRYALAGFAVLFFAFMRSKGISDQPLTLRGFYSLAVLTGLGATVAHGLAYQARPARRFALFYLILATAGLGAGLFATLGAPLLFSRNLEFALAAALLLGLGAIRLLARPEWSARFALVAALVGPSLWAARDQWLADRGRTHFRNHYGHLILTRTRDAIAVSNETTVHGCQLLDPGQRHVPTSYYTRGSGVGLALAALQGEKPALRLGAIGLGTGTLAAYVRPADAIVFWDINPLSVKIARENFTFLADAPGRTEVRLRDGRLGVREDTGRFDAIILDAFTGDSIPIHLVTREAIRDYQARLTPDGVLLVHISNRHIDLLPALATHARKTGWKFVQIVAAPNATLRQTELAQESAYVLLYPPARDPAIGRWLSTALQNPDYDYTLKYEGATVDWTDDRHAILEALKP